MKRLLLLGAALVLACMGWHSKGSAARHLSAARMYQRPGDSEGIQMLAGSGTALELDG